MIPDPIVLVVELSAFTSLAFSFRDLVLRTPEPDCFIIFGYQRQIYCKM